MARRMRGPSQGPKKGEWVDGTLLTYTALTELIMRWDAGTVVEMRRELVLVRDISEGLLRRGGLIERP